jgi:hypothetical protein
MPPSAETHSELDLLTRRLPPATSLAKPHKHGTVREAKAALFFEISASASSTRRPSDAIGKGFSCIGVFAGQSRLIKVRSFPAKEWRGVLDVDLFLPGSFPLFVIFVVYPAFSTRFQSRLIKVDKGCFSSATKNWAVFACISAFSFLLSGSWTVL